MEERGQFHNLVKFKGQIKKRKSKRGPIEKLKVVYCNFLNFLFREKPRNFHIWYPKPRAPRLCPPSSSLSLCDFHRQWSYKVTPLLPYLSLLISLSNFSLSSSLSSFSLISFSLSSSLYSFSLISFS